MRRISGFLVLLLHVFPVWAGILDSPSDRAIAAVQEEAREQHMPTDFFGIRWLTTKSDLLNARRNAVAQGDDYYSEAVSYVGRNATIAYYVKTGNVLMYIVTFTDQSTEGSFQGAHKALDKSFGPMSAPKDEVDEYGKKRCSHRATSRFGIDHCVRVHGQTPVENIVFYRRKPG